MRVFHHALGGVAFCFCNRLLFGKWGICTGWRYPFGLGVSDTLSALFISDCLAHLFGRRFGLVAGFNVPSPTRPGGAIRTTERRPYPPWLPMGALVVLARHVLEPCN